MSFKNIILGTQRKNYTHDLSFDNNTTMGFGVLQPLLCQYMFPKLPLSNLFVLLRCLLLLLLVCISLTSPLLLR